MIFIFILIGFFLYLINKSNWEINVKILLLLFPFFGFIAGYLEGYSATRITSLFYDFILIIPIYLSVMTMKRSHGYFNMMSADLRFGFFILTFLILIQFFNPYNNLSLIGKLVGLKVWLFYFLLVPVGFYYIKSKDQIISTQNFVRFDIAEGIRLFRIPSTFSYPAQFSNYLLLSLVPALTTLNCSKNKKEKNLYSILILLIFLASIASGISGMYIYIPIFFIFYWFINSEILKIARYTLILLFSIIIIFITDFANLDIFLSDIKRQFMNYKSSTLKGGSNYLLNNFAGNGIGSNTPQVNNVTGIRNQIGPDLNESYFFKVIGELGFFGLVALLIFYTSI